MSTITAAPRMRRVYSFGDLREVAANGGAVAIAPFLAHQPLERLERLERVVVDAFTALHEADAFYLVDYLFTSEGVKSHGAQFWMDVWMTSTVNRALKGS